MKFDRVRVQLSELAAPVVTVAPWETPILKAIHGEPDIRVLEQAEVSREPPEPSDEYTRLANLYPGAEGAAPFVAQVYGQHGAGVAALAAAIDRACARGKGAPASR
jgi:hypothetical protein